MKLNKIIRLYVPGTINNKINLAAQEKWVDEALDKFADLFGGATTMQAQGAWKAGGVIVKEPIVLVYAFTDDVGLSQHCETVIEFAKIIAVSMGQECVSVEIERELHLIYPAKAA
jgi:hypothetical protein